MHLNTNTQSKMKSFKDKYKEYIFVMFISHMNILINVSKWVVKYKTIEHIYASIIVFTSYTIWDGEKQVCFGDFKQRKNYSEACI